ncbi:hypothetical protein DH2020_040950 [Rehmannia glutinosa]|uniref:O-methyltransferase C-terminal domain-containing protein n=1 Tax=Rehmannia glutinosa TaxID=99300 RepID=A0ABR0US89_REHGL
MNRYHLKDAVVDGGIPFNKAFGMGLFEYFATDPGFSEVFNQAMSNYSTMFMKKILETYDGFEHLKSMVDVGGGVGAALSMIVSKYPSIKGINFDLPDVIQHVPSYPGVEHVGGDMFVSVPKSDAIFLQDLAELTKQERNEGRDAEGFRLWVLVLGKELGFNCERRICHDWSDEQCLRLLKNCHEVLPENGKVILAEFVLPEIPDNGLLTKNVINVDLLMLAQTPGGKERTEIEFQALAKGVGFKEFHKVCCAHSVWIMELYAVIVNSCYFLARNKVSLI